MATGNPMKVRKLPAWLLVAGAAACFAPVHLLAQESKPTIRHHRIEETVPDDSSSPEVDQAETAMQHNDLASAETLLQKAVTAKPNDYRAWFDLGYVYNATQRQPQAIDAYRKAVAAKPDVFESNLNLGLLLAKQGDNAEAAKYLKAATQLKPSANPRGRTGPGLAGPGKGGGERRSAAALDSVCRSGQAESQRCPNLTSMRPSLIRRQKPSGRSGARVSGGG